MENNKIAWLTERDNETYRQMLRDGIISRGNPARMQKLFARAAAGEALTLAFLGGSITQGCHSNTPQTCYAHRVFDWFRSTFPQANFTYINAGIGGTTSYFGVARVEQDVLVKEPDFVMVEFSVNDTADEFFMETYEGLLRRILYSPKKPAMMVLNNIQYNDGYSAQDYHNRLTVAYGIPTASLRESLYARLQKGMLEIADISGDALHPNELGHQVLADVACHLLEQLRLGDVPMEPLTRNRFADTRRIQNYNAKPVCEGFVADEAPQGHIGDTFKRGWTASELGSRITFQVVGTSIGVQYRKTMALPAPIAKVTIDGETEQAKYLDANFHETWGDSLELELIAMDLEHREHQVVIELVETHPEDQKPFYLTALMVSGKEA